MMSGQLARLVRLVLRPTIAVVGLAVSAGFLSSQPPTGAVVGIATSLPTGQPLAGAMFVVAGTDRRMTSDSAGTFRVGGLPGGKFTIEGRAIGFEAMALAVSILLDSTVRLHFEFRPLVVQLPGIEVDAGSLPASEARLKGFHERRAAGFGRFITRDDIVRRDPRDSWELLRGIPGVRLVGKRVQMSTGQTRGCVVQYFVDGLHIVFPPSDLLIQFLPRDLEGIEVYRGPAETPVAFSRGGAECGVIAIWTRMGGRP